MLLKIILFILAAFLSQSIYAGKTSGPVPKGLSIKNEDGSESKRWAIVIGVNDYNDIAITDLTKARNDAKIVGQILTEQGEFEKVYIMTDDLNSKDPLYPTRVNIESKLDSILDFAESGDLIFFYFSGHGVSDNDGKGYILPVDTAMDKAFYTSVKVDDIIKRINDKGIKKSLLVLDACRDVLATSKSSNKQGLQADKYEDAEVAATFFSTKAGAYSFEDPKSDFGVFTKYLAYALEGKADADSDGVVTFSEVESYVQKNVSEWSQVNNKKQVPYVRYQREKLGDLPITVRGKREKSLVEENEYGKGDTRLPQAWRSALVPGWGQWYDGGKEKAISYFSVAAILGLVVFKANQNFNEKQAVYSNTFGIPATPGGGDTFGFNYLLIKNARQDVIEAQGQYNLAVQLLGAFWIWNVADIFIFQKNEYFWTMQFNMKPAWDGYAGKQVLEPNTYFIIQGKW